MNTAAAASRDALHKARSILATELVLQILLSCSPVLQLLTPLLPLHAPCFICCCCMLLTACSAELHWVTRQCCCRMLLAAACRPD